MGFTTQQTQLGTTSVRTIILCRVSLCQVQEKVVIRWKAQSGQQPQRHARMKPMLNDFMLIVSDVFHGTSRSIFDAWRHWDCHSTNTGAEGQGPLGRFWAILISQENHRKMVVLTCFNMF
jgi:hypothetical protein